jgi:hypothetical protein
MKSDQGANLWRVRMVGASQRSEPAFDRDAVPGAPVTALGESADADIARHGHPAVGGEVVISPAEESKLLPSTPTVPPTSRSFWKVGSCAVPAWPR